MITILTDITFIMLISDLPSLYAWRPLGKCHCTEVLLNTLKHDLWFTLMVLLTITFFFYCISGNLTTLASQITC